MNNYYKHWSISILMLILSITTVFAQQSVTGRVTDANGGLPGVTITVTGTNRATQSTSNGNFTIQANNGEKLKFSIIGYLTQEITVSGTSVNVTLEQDASGIDEVVVTAMGIKREKKSLGYSFQDIKGEALVDARENNIANALTGKVAGLQIIKGSAGPASSSKIVLRGFTSFTGDNQPLIVVDGVPMENFAGASNNDFWNPSADMGNGLGDLNPEDIESMSVLKGGAASALYGSRALNGVILITTKSGKSSRGAGISYSATMGLENLFVTPELQKDFSQGSDGVFNATSGSNWGEKITGQSVTGWDDKSRTLQVYDNLGNFFKTGFNTTHNLTFQQSLSEGTNIYTSATYLHDNSKTPGVKLDRLNLMSKLTSTFGKEKRWTTDIKVQYMNTVANNRAVGGSNAGNYYSVALLTPNTIDITEFQSGMDQLAVNQTWYNNSNTVNPYWAVSNKLNKDSRNRFLLNATIKYRFNDWLDADFRAGSDLYNTKFDSRTYTGSSLPNSYGVGSDNFNERNYIVSLNARKDNLFGKWNGSASLFGQIMKQNSNWLSSSAGSLTVPNLFTLGNSEGNPGFSEGISEKQINSLFGTAEINYDNFWFINVTGRNDWSSTLSKANRSYFYPSISTSLVISDMIEKTGGNNPSWLNFAKVRASYAETGSSLPPYSLYNTYSIGKDPNGYTTASKNETLYDPNLVSELLKSFEVGFDVKLFNRLSLDFAYYKTNATNQLIRLSMNPLSGYKNYMANAGNIQNKGIETMVGINVLKNPETLMWDINVNYSKNLNELIALTDELRLYPLGGFDNLQVNSTVGQRYGTIYGTKYTRVEDENSPYYGQKIINGNGLPTASDDKFLLGDQSARALIGINNSFAYKNIGLSFLIDGRFGGKFFSGTNLALQRAGLAAETVVNGERAPFVVEGVVSDGSGGYTVNTKEVTHQQYWNQVTNTSGNLGITEENLYDATNIRLRNVQLSYRIPARLLNTSVVKSAKFSLSANNVWMIKSHANGVDPESVYAISTNAVGFEYLSFPTSRSYFLNISLGF
ncbi:SusC/RagA family TonB-linked outer membrane protein [Sphingobacterium composti Ten et al. 2007 non Yoo et al. 2007]|uniref:SusC/RagA family TonB-linked outer membrane protein n=1 Tax=Sphingobacterium composti TaxID=363260 RepID=UPI00135BAB4B|nr:SusC/RagA family TonB-linked outer membrane protein [Sphingobacterium composti Ten et al. 2007 non Yoo et al. 2007]